jgi:hypothetical protein
VRQSVNGLETALAMFMIALTLRYYVDVYRHCPRPRTRETLILGSLLALTVLARVDAALFALTVAADDLWRRRRGALQPVLQYGSVCVVFLLPWCIGSQILVGDLLPGSGRATRFLSAAYAPHDIPELAQMEPSSTLPLLGHNVLRSGMLLGTAPALHVPTRALEKLLDAFHLGADAKHCVIAVFLVSSLAVAAGLWRRQRARGFPRTCDFDFLFLHAALLVMAYSFVVYGHIFFSRYYYPIFFFSTLLSASVFEALLDLLGRGRQRRRVVAAAIIAAYVLLLPYMSWNRVRRDDYRFLNAAQWIEARTPPDTRIGIFNSGAIGYFSDRRVVNLDGKVNPAALKALRQNRMRDYVSAAEIDYVVDHHWILERFLQNSSAAVTWPTVASDGALGVPGWTALRVEPASNGPHLRALPHAAGSPLQASRP